MIKKLLKLFGIFVSRRRESDYLVRFSLSWWFFRVKYWIFRNPYSISENGEWPYRIWFYPVGVAFHGGPIADCHLEIDSCLIRKPFKGEYAYEFQVGPFVFQWWHVPDTKRFHRRNVILGSRLSIWTDDIWRTF